jgi:integral membrane sensor domain MASE1
LARSSLFDLAAMRRFVLIAGLTALAYALAGWLSLKLSTYISGTVAAVWLAAGIGAAASLRYGASGVVGVLLGSLMVNSQILPLEDAFRLALGAATGAWIMGTLPRYLQPFSSTLDHVSSVAKFALVAAPLGSAVSALVGVFTLNFYGDLPAAMIFRGLWVWWLGDLLGVFLIAPLLLTAARWDLLPTNRGARLEGMVLVLGMLALTLVMMHYAEPLRPAEIVLFVMVPAVLWAALRFTVTGASLAIFLAALIVMGVAVVSYGGITSATTPSDVFGLQISMITMALGGLFVSAALAERRYSEMRLESRPADRTAQSLVLPGLSQPCAGACAAREIPGFTAVHRPRSLQAYQRLARSRCWGSGAGHRRPATGRTVACRGFRRPSGWRRICRHPEPPAGLARRQPGGPQTEPGAD